MAAESYFSDYFKIDPSVLDEYGAFNISLITDLPLFIDPFLLFTSKKQKYRRLHDRIIKYLIFLRDHAKGEALDRGLLNAWYRFPEVKQNWMGFTVGGNSGSGLGQHFALALNENLHRLFQDFGNEHITKGSHLEKLCLIREGVGRDNISDFTTNLIKDFLCEYTEAFAKKYLVEGQHKSVSVEKATFNYETETWMSRTFELPWARGDYVILIPKDILTKDDTWINKTDLINDFADLPDAIPDAELRSQINNYFRKILSGERARSRLGKRERKQHEKRFSNFRNSSIISFVKKKTRARPPKV